MLNCMDGEVHSGQKSQVILNIPMPCKIYQICLYIFCTISNLPQQINKVVVVLEAYKSLSLIPNPEYKQQTTKLIAAYMNLLDK